jgi:hypothetical protein
MPLHIISQHADKDMGPHMVSCMMPDRRDQQIDSLQTPESTFHLCEILIAAYSVFHRKTLSRSLRISLAFTMTVDNTRRQEKYPQSGGKGPFKKERGD